MSKINQILEELNLEIDESTAEKLVEAFENSVHITATALYEEKEAEKKDEEEKEDDDEKEELEEKLKVAFELLAEARDTIIGYQESIEEKVEAYLEENKASIPDADTYNRMVSVFETVKNAFEVNGFDLDSNAALNEANSKYHELEEASNKLIEAFEKINGELSEANIRNESLNEELENVSREVIFEQRSRDLTETQIEKAKTLVESVTFNSREEYEEGLSMIFEQIGAPVSGAADLPPSEKLEEKKEKDPRIMGYLKELRRQNSVL